MADPPFLIRLPADSLELRYSPGTLDRAARLQSRLLALQADLYRRNGLQAPLTVLVVTRQDWEALELGSGYGIPLFTGREIVSPAWGDDATVELWRRSIAGALPLPDGMPLIGTREQAGSMALADLILLLDAAEVFLLGSGFHGEADWVVPATAHLLVTQSLERWDPSGALSLDRLLGALQRGSTTEALNRRVEAWQRCQVRDPKWQKRLKKTLSKARSNGGLLSIAAMSDWLSAAAIEG